VEWGLPYTPSSAATSDAASPATPGTGYRPYNQVHLSRLIQPRKFFSSQPLKIRVGRLAADMAMGLKFNPFFKDGRMIDLYQVLPEAFRVDSNQHKGAAVEGNE